MSRTPKCNVDKLPKWVQQRLTMQEAVIDELTAQISDLDGVIELLNGQIEWLSEAVK